MTIKERTKKFIDYKKITVSKFEELCDLSNGYIAAMRKGYGTEKLNNVLTAFPELNREWLLYGEGTMLKTEAKMTPIGDEWVEADFSQEQSLKMQKREDGTVVISHTPERRSRAVVYAHNLQRKGVGVVLEALAPIGVSGTLPKAQQSATPAEAMRDGVNVITDAAALDLSIIPAEVVEELKAEIKSEEAVPIIPTEVANRLETDVKEYIEDNAAELEHFRPGDMTADADGAEKVQKTSMLPTFVPNDIVFIKFLRDKTKIIDGHTYYFDLRSRPTMIRKVKIENGKLRLIAQNPDFGDIITTFDDVLNVANIVGLFRKTFGDQYSELESVRRQKDTLIKEQIKQNGEALKTIDRLVTVIEKKL